MNRQQHTHRPTSRLKRLLRKGRWALVYIGVGGYFYFFSESLYMTIDLPPLSTKLYFVAYGLGALVGLRWVVKEWKGWTLGQRWLAWVSPLLTSLLGGLVLIGGYGTWAMANQYLPTSEPAYSVSLVVKERGKKGAGRSRYYWLKGNLLDDNCQPTGKEVFFYVHGRFWDKVSRMDTVDFRLQRGALGYTYIQSHQKHGHRRL